MNLDVMCGNVIESQIDAVEVLLFNSVLCHYFYRYWERLPVLWLSCNI
jgi:hypothetical protein